MLWIPIAVLVFFAHVILLAVGNAKDANNKRKEDAFNQERDRFIKAVTDERIEEEANRMAASLTREERAKFIGEFVGNTDLCWGNLTMSYIASNVFTKYPAQLGTYVLAYMASNGKLPRTAVFSFSYGSLDRTISKIEETDRMAFLLVGKVRDILRARYPELNVDLIVRPAGSGPTTHYRFDEYQSKFGTSCLNHNFITEFSWNKTTPESLIADVK